MCVSRQTLNVWDQNWNIFNSCSTNETTHLYFSHTYYSSSWFHPKLPLPDLFCHVTPLIGWHVISSLACAVGCHLHGNKSLLLNVGGGSIQDCMHTFSKHPCPTLINSPESNLFGPKGVIVISRWRFLLIKHCIFMAVFKEELYQINPFTDWLLLIQRCTWNLVFICSYKPPAIHYWVISFWPLYQLRAHLSCRSLALAQRLLVYSVSAKASK